jgi:hypothetical protein
MSGLRANLKFLAAAAIVAGCATASAPPPKAAAPSASLASASTIDECVSGDTSTAWQHVARAFSRDTGHTWSDDSLRARLLAVADSDQMVRSSAGMQDSLGNTDFLRRMAVRDSVSDAVLRAIVAAHGWPTRSLVGIEGAHAAWLLLQHDLAFQAELLPRLQAERRGEIAPADLAMLEDRVRVNSGRPQRYGSQLQPVVEGRPLRYSPIEDVAGLEARRAAVGLPPLPVYSCMMRVVYGRPVVPPG